MNDKVLKWLVGMLLVFTSLLIYQKNDYNFKIAQAEKEYKLTDNFMPFEIPDMLRTEQQYPKTLKELQKVSQQTQTNFVKRSLYEGYEMVNGKINYNKEKNMTQFQVSDTRPTKLMQNFNRKPVKINNDIKHLNNSLRGYSVSIKPIQQTIKTGTAEGTFFVETTDKKQYNLFLTKLAKHLSNFYEYDLTADDLTLTKEEAQDQTELEFDDEISPQIIQTLVIFLILFLIIWLLSNSNTLSIFQLNGFSLTKAFINVLGKTITISFFSTMILDVLAFIAFDWTFSYQTLLKQMFLYIIVTIAGLLIVTFLRALNIANQLKKKNYTKFIFFTLYVLKCFFLFSCINAFIPFIQVATGIYSVSTSNEVQNIQKEYATFYPRVNGYDPSFISDEKIQEIDHSMYGPLTEKGSLILEDSGLKQPDSIDEVVKYVVVSPNYLKHFPLYDINDERIQVSNEEEQLIVCLPKEKKPLKSELVSYLKYVSDDVLGKVPSIKVVYTNTQRSFINLNDGENISNQIIIIGTNETTSYVDRNMMNGMGLEDGLKIPINGSIKKTYSELSPLLKENNYDDNYPQLVAMDDIPKEDLKITIGNIVSQSILISVNFIVVMILISYVTLLYFKIYKREIVLKRINGYSLLEAGRQLWLLTALQYGAIIGLFIVDHAFNSYNFSILAGFFTIEIVITTFVFQKITKNLGGNLNGK